MREAQIPVAARPLQWADLPPDNQRRESRVQKKCGNVLKFSTNQSSCSDVS